MADHIIKTITRDGIWMLGSIDDYPFQFRVHEKNSPRYGIEGGRILKLQVSDKGSKMPLFVYERGWLRKGNQTPPFRSPHHLRRLRRVLWA